MKQHEGDAVHLEDIDGNVAMSNYEEMTSALEIHKSDIPNLFDDLWTERLTTMTDRFATQQMEQMIRTLDRVTAQTGNVINAQGAPVSEDLLLNIFDTAVLDFENGEISPDFCLLTSQKTSEKFASLELTDDFKRKHRAIIDRQYIDWRLREADRKLVD